MQAMELLKRNEVTRPVKRIYIEIFGRRFDICVSGDITMEKLNASIGAFNNTLAKYYFPVLIIADNTLLLLEQSLQKHGAYKFDTKKNFRQLQQSLRKRINRMHECFVMGECYEELSAQVWDDISDNIAEMTERIYDDIRKVGTDEANADIYAHLITAANMIYESRDIYDSVLRSIHERYHVNFDKTQDHISTAKECNFVEQWCKSFVKEYKKIQDALKADKKTSKIYEEVDNSILNIKNMEKRKERMNAELHDLTNIQWHKMSERPKNGSSIWIFSDGSKKEYRYYNNFLEKEDGNKIRWGKNEKRLWAYKES
jgi:hypothetical protein